MCADRFPNPSLLVALAIGLAALAVPVSAWEGEDAAIDSVDLPSPVTCGSAFRATVTVRNTGFTTWVGPAFELAATGETLFGAGVRASLPAGKEVAPDEPYTFALRLEAPEIPRSAASISWRMRHGGVWFGATGEASTDVVCAPSVEDAEPVSDDLPRTLACGERRGAQITVRNTGETTWTAGSHSLRSLAPGVLASAARVALPQGGADVSPGGEHTFDVVLVAPAREGTYDVGWQVERRGRGRFGSEVSRPIVVTCPTSDADPSK